MTPICDRLQDFAHGELGPEEHQAFAAHLPGCAKCQAGLAELIQFDLALQEAGSTASVRTLTRRATPRLAQRWMPLAMAASLVVAVGAVWLLVSSGSSSPVAIATAPSRGLDARFTHPGASSYRPYGASRAAGAGAETVTLDTLSRLEEKKDLHGLATAYLLQRQLDRAEQYLGQTPSSPDVDSDRAVLALDRGDLEQALRLLDGVLASQPRHPQALWNRGLALERLGLPLTAAESFAAVATLQEAGWSQEAEQRAAALRKERLAQRDGWLNAEQLGRAMVEGGAVLPVELAARYPGPARRFFHDAVRTATSRARVEELLPLAQELDRLQGGSVVLQQYTRRVAEADFTRRAPLAKAYLALFQGKPPASSVEALLDQMQASSALDLELGALLLTERAQAHLDRCRELAAGTADPWFEVLVAHEHAKALIRRGEMQEAEKRLLEAVARSDGAKTFSLPASLEWELARLTSTERRPEDALRHATRGMRLAEEGSEWALAQRFVLLLAEIHRAAGKAFLADAFAREGVLREPER